MKTPIFVIALAVLIGGCAHSDYDPFVSGVDRQLETRVYQTREFESLQYEHLMQAVVSTLLDHHFRLSHVNRELGTISAQQHTKLTLGRGVNNRTEATVFVRPLEAKSFAVRLNMTIGPEVENRAQLHQHFFAALDRKLFSYR